jgi:hypothetical protein
MSAGRGARRIRYVILPHTEFAAAGLLRAPEAALLEKLNRADRAHLSRLKQVIVPTRWKDNELAFSPLPESYSIAKDKRKLIVVDQHNQVFGAYERGDLVRWGPISTGRQERQTPDGLFHLHWRSKRHHSTVDHSELAWYFNFDESRGIGFHEHPLPGRPASDGCVRLLERDAKWLYHWGEPQRRAQQGVMVMIFGRYDFRSPPPWYSARSSAEKIELPDEK